jgi:hypothetical protein
MGMLVTDVTAADKARTIQFSGHRWQVKQSDRPVGPGPNWFSGREENVWVDEKGRLHLRISQREGHWWCAEVYTDKNLGYGTYVFRIAGKLHELDKSAVLGLFTWDDNTFLNAANSEIDIEFARSPDAGARG